MLGILQSIVFAEPHSTTVTNDFNTPLGLQLIAVCLGPIHLEVRLGGIGLGEGIVRVEDID